MSRNLQTHSHYQHLTIPQFQKNNKITNATPYYIYSSEQTLPRHMRTKLAQFRANKAPLLQSHLHTVNPDT